MYVYTFSQVVVYYHKDNPIYMFIYVYTYMHKHFLKLLLMITRIISFQYEYIY